MTMTTHPIDVLTIDPIGHDEAMTLAQVEYERIADAFAALDADSWDRPTDCTAWSVRDLGGHVVGAMRSAASTRELARQNVTATIRAKRQGGAMVDHLTALQIEATHDLDPDALVAEMRGLVERATRGRSRLPAVLRRSMSMRVVFGSFDERWKLGYLNDVILTRDIWMHRVDLARAVGGEPVLDRDHDRRIVADVVAEWARRHGMPFALELEGPAGGHYVGAGSADAPAPDSDPAVVRVDAVEFCRTLSGRASGSGLISQEVPF